MITLHDSPNSDLDIVDAMADMSENFNLYDYVSIRQKNGREWIGQIVFPNRNISTLGGRTDPVILHGLELMQQHDNVQAVKSVQVYGIRLMGYYEDGSMHTLRTRPLPGSVATKLSSDITMDILNLPKYDKTNAIGELLVADKVPVTVRPAIFNHHIMVAGGTGSGKSNVAANLIAQAAKMGKCVIVHDAKPDYKKIQAANSDKNVKKIWELAAEYNLSPQAAKNVIRAGFLGRCDKDEIEHEITLASMDFPPDVLAGVFFPHKAEHPQREAFLDAIHNREKYTLELIKEIIQRSDTHEATKKAALRKINVRGRRMPWLDDNAEATQGGVMDSPTLDNIGPKRSHGNQITSLFRKGRIIVVDYSHSQMGEDDYALILSFFLRICQKFRRENKGGIGIVQLIDEAHRVFDNQSNHSDSLAASFARTMREGRTLDHSIILSLQSASLIPGNVRTNLNSRFVMHQNSKYDSDCATETMPRNFSASAMGLGTGHSLVSMHESPAVVLAQMFPSPYELMRTDNMDKPV